MLLRVNVTHQGLSPILMNPVSQELLEALRTRTSGGKDRTKSVYEEAEDKVILDEEGRIGIPNMMYFSCLVEAGRSVKGPDVKQISTATSTSLPSFLVIEDQFFPFPEGTDWVPDQRRGTNPKDGALVSIVRPKVIDWSFTASIVIDLSVMNPEIVMQLIRVGGRKCGLGDFRPACRGQFGMFKMTRWEEVKEWDEKDEVEVIQLPSRRKQSAASETTPQVKRRSPREAKGGVVAS